MKLGTVMKVVGGIATVGAAAVGTIMLIGKKTLNKYEKETVVVETPLDETAEEAAEIPAEAEESAQEASDVMGDDEAQDNQKIRA